MRRRVGKGSAYQGPFLISGMQVGIIGVVILITLLISAWNAIDLRKVLDHSTEEYLYQSLPRGICRIPLGRERIRQSFKIFWKRRPECWSLIF